MSVPNRKRIGIVFLCVVAAGAVFHQEIVGRVTYAVEKAKLEAGRQQLNGTGRIEEISETFRLVAKEIRPTVVKIVTRSTPSKSESRRGSTRRDIPRDIPEPLRKLFEEYEGREMPTPPPQQSSGSGVIIDADRGLVLTNNHVVSEGDGDKLRIEVLLPDGRRLHGDDVITVLGRDKATDLALLQIKAPRLHAAVLGDSDAMQVGDWVLAIGAPFDLDQTVTQGIISAKGRSITRGYNDFLQTDAAINPGNSGGPLVNMRGEVIGINTAIATTGLVAGYMGVGFSIPSNMVKDALTTLREGKEIVRGYLGVKIIGASEWEPGLAESYGLKDETGVLIYNFYRPDVSDTPAQKAGLKIDDIILSYNGKKVSSAIELQGLVAHTKPGTKVDLKVWRDKKEITIPVKIETQPDDFFAQGAPRRGGRGQQKEDGQEESPDATIESLGMTVEPLGAATAKRYGWDQEDNKNQLVVTEVEPLGEAGSLGIQPGDLIMSVQSKAIQSVRDLKNALSKEALAKGVRIRVNRPKEGSQMFFLQLGS